MFKSYQNLFIFTILLCGSLASASPININSCLIFLKSNTSLESVLIQDDLVTWRNLEPDEMVTLFANVDNSGFNREVQNAIETGLTESEIYSNTGKLNRLGYQIFKKFISLVKRLSNSSDVSADYNFSYTLTGSSFIIRVRANKKNIEKVAKTLQLTRAWLGRDDLSLPGNRIQVWEGAFYSALNGSRTVDFRKGINRGYQVGPGEFYMGNKVIPIIIEEVKEIPYSQVTRQDLDGQRMGLSYDDMFNTMRGYYPDLVETDLITVLRFRLR